jgi:hypothetical protein
MVNVFYRPGVIDHHILIVSGVFLKRRIEMKSDEILADLVVKLETNKKMLICPPGKTTCESGCRECLVKWARNKEREWLDSLSREETNIEILRRAGLCYNQDEKD